MSSFCRTWRLRGGTFGILLLAGGVAQGGAPSGPAQNAGPHQNAGQANGRQAANDLKLTRPANSPIAAPTFGAGELVDQVESQQRAVAGFLQAEVRNALRNARGQAATDPEQAENHLKLLRDKLARSVELEPATRARLVEQIDGELKAVRRQAKVQAERRLQTQQIAAEREARERLNRQLGLQEQKVDQLMSRYNALVAERRFREAEAVAGIAEEMQPNRAGLRGAELTARMAGDTLGILAVRDLRHRGFVDATQQVELANIPTPDEPPILYPDPETWQLLSERRKKYKAVDLTQHGPNEAKILAALDEPTELDFVEQPLSDVLDYLKQRHGIEIQIDARALADSGLGTETPITRAIKGITLRSALKLILSELDLTYVMRNEVLLITSRAEADNMLSTRVYPVADLVVPIRQPTNMGGMRGMPGSSGGMGGMGMGGMGMGGMGMGMGGMMPGMGMGMGGGF